jgi:hypothetical protein
MGWLETGYDEHMRAVKGAQHQQKLSEAERKVAAGLRAKFGAERATVSATAQLYLLQQSTFASALFVCCHAIRLLSLYHFSVAVQRYACMLV